MFIGNLYLRVMSEALERFLTRSAISRGQIISSASMLERLLDLSLSRYFSKSDEGQREMLELIFCTERINFRSKYHLLLEVISRLCDKKKIVFDDHFKGLQKKFDDVSSIRNKFAHEAELIGEDMDEKVLNAFSVILISLKDIKGKSTFYTQAQVEEELAKMSDLIEHMGKIHDWLVRDGQIPSNKVQESDTKS
jgi:hypothetical protein